MYSHTRKMLNHSKLLVLNGEREIDLKKYNSEKLAINNTVV